MEGTLLCYISVKGHFECTGLAFCEEWVLLQKGEAERYCEFIFMIDFCMDFYPEVLGTS